MQVRNAIAFAIPFFLLFMALELFVGRARGRRGLYRLPDVLADLGCGVGQQITMVFAGGAILAGYTLLYDRFRLVTFSPSSLVPWIIAFFAVDLLYYAWHRLSHEVNVLWAAHGVHHQSEDYNLAVALRQSIVTSFTALPFYYPMAFLGVPPIAYAATVGFSTLYQFWIHTELVGRLGPLERVLNTPSHHRVHHAVNPQYLDKNYGAVLIVWDRLFGTYAPEEASPVYGTTKPLASFDPVWAQVQLYAALASRSRRLRGWDRLRVWWASPAWDPGGETPPSEAELLARPKHDPPLAAWVRPYAAAQFAPLVAATFLMILLQMTAPRSSLAVAAALALATLLAVGALLDGRRWAVPLELSRLCLVAVAVAVVRPPGATGALLAACAALLAALSGGWVVVTARGAARRARAAPGTAPSTPRSQAARAAG